MMERAKRIWRLLGICLAAVSLVMLTIPVFGIQFSPLFLNFLEQLETWETFLFFQFITPIVHSAIEVINRTFALNLQVADWWRHAFVLQWLLFGAMTRAHAWTGLKGLGLAAQYAWAGVTALAGSVAIGMAPMASMSTLLFFIASLFAFLAFAPRQPGAGKVAPGARVMVGVIAAGAAVAAIMSMNDSTTESLLGGSYPSPGLADMVFWVGLMGAFFLLLGVSVSQRGIRFNNDAAILGADIVGAYGVAAFLVFIGVYVL
jgi:hypothetical protein